MLRGHFAYQAAQTTRYDIKTFGGIVPYAPRAAETYDLLQQRATQQQASLQRAQVSEQYDHYWRERVAQVKASLPAGELHALTARIKSDLRAAGAIACEARGLETKVRVDEVLAQRAGVLPFEAWCQQHGEA